MSTRAWVLFALSSVVWGIPYLFIKIAVDAGVPPGFVAWSRIALAAILLVPIALRRRAMTGLRARAGAIVAYAACEMAVPFVLIAIGEQHVSSSLTAILIATMPLMVGVLSLWLRAADRPTGLRLLGLVIGFGGVVVLLGVDVAGRTGELFGAGLVLLATVCYAIAPLIVARYLADLDPLGPVTASLLVSMVALLPAAIIAPPGAALTPEAVGALVLLGVVCTALGLIVFFRLIAEAGPARASVITYVNPLVAVMVGVVVLGERVTPAAGVGLLLILLGSWASTRGAVPGH